jgi:hypothetical protein
MTYRLNYKPNLVYCLSLLGRDPSVSLRPQRPLRDGGFWPDQAVGGDAAGSHGPHQGRDSPIFKNYS